MDSTFATHSNHFRRHKIHPHSTARHHSITLFLTASMLVLGSAIGCSSNKQSPPNYPAAGQDPNAPAAPGQAPNQPMPEEGAPGEPAPAPNDPAAQPGAQAPAPSPGEPVEGQELDTFIQTYAEIINIQAGYQTKAASAESPEDMQSIQQDMNRDVVDAVESNGFTPQRFDQIVQQVQQDAELRARVESELNAMHGSGG